MTLKRLAEAMNAAAIYGLAHEPDLERIERNTREEVVIAYGGEPQQLSGERSDQGRKTVDGRADNEPDGMPPVLRVMLPWFPAASN